MSIFTNFVFVTFYIVSVVQRVTAWIAGVPVLKLVIESSDSNISHSKQPVHQPATCQASSSARNRKRRADSLEDEEMHAKLRKGNSYVRNARQEQELSQLKEGGLCGQYVDKRFFL